MSRTSIAAFLSKAKQSLQQSLRSKGEHPASFVIGNESADLDSITCALVYGYIQSNKSHIHKSGQYVIPIANIPSTELKLRPELTALLRHADLRPSDLITLDDIESDGQKLHQIIPADRTEWTLVDHNVLQGTLGKYYGDRVIAVIDHHEDEGKILKEAKTRIIEKTGSCNSHVVDYCKFNWDSLSSSNTGDEDNTTIDAQLATLALGSILIDTFKLKDQSKVTDHDREAVKYLEAKIRALPQLGSKYDRDAFFKKINDAKSNLDDLTLEEILRKDYKEWSENNIRLGVSAVVKPIKYLKTKTEEGDFVSNLLSFANARGLHLYAVMTAHADNDTFERQLLLFAMEDGKPVKIAEKFVNTDSKELQLEASSTNVDDSSAKWLRLWEQKNLAASRKQVAPLLRQAMG